jgi:Arc/MetJ-type ribon-helix-helix transcriptional regulator
MAPSSRDRISVDLRGLKAALVARARVQGVSPSDVVRASLTDALGEGDRAAPVEVAQANYATARVRLSLRMQRSDRDAVLRAAREARLSAGDFVAALVRKVPALARSGPAAQIEALTQSCAELAELSRSLHHLATLLRQGAGRAAQEYRGTLDSLDHDVHAHLALASSIVAELRPLLRTNRQRDAYPTA